MIPTPFQRRNRTSGALNPIPENFRKLWDVWDLRICVLSSLVLQAFLILFGSLRKRSSSKVSISFIWSAYLLADWVAAFALGLISQGNDDDSIKTEELQAFWAPFLLLHLGGPDTITAFALEDNELWVRHLLGLIFQFLAAGYIFFQTLPDNQLWIAIVLMFLAGLIKYAERTRSLCLASLGRFRDSLLTAPDPGPNYAKLMAEYSSMLEANLPAKIEMMTEPEAPSKDYHSIATKEIDKKEKLKYAYNFFETFKGLIVDMIFSFHDRSNSRDFFLQRKTEDAFEVVEIELGFMYEVLYTKAAVVHSRLGYFLRFVAFSSTVISLVLFLSYEKLHLPEVDVIITYMLLIGAMMLDVISLLMLIFSERTVASDKSSRLNNIVSAIERRVPIPRRSRWSKTVSQFNFINFTLSKRPNSVDWVVDYLGLKDLVDEMYYSSCTPVTEELKEFIFSTLQKKSKIAKDPKSAKETSSARGDWVLARSKYRKLLAWSVEVDYDESLLLWHIATEIVFHKNQNDETQNTKARELSKLISDYMLYLLVMKPTMMLGVGGIGKIRFRDTCAEAKVFYSGLERKESKDGCDKLFDVNTDIKPAEVKGDRSKSVLFDAVILAKLLQGEVTVKRWELISQMWLELLCYAAIQCKGNSHAQQLSKGGELLTFVWLLMTHLGFGEQFRIEIGHARAKLIVNS